MLGLAAFVFGLAGGIFSTVRKQFTISVTGTSLVLIFGFVTIFTSALEGSVIGGLVFGFPPLLLSALGVVFASVSKSAA
jgi:hypothetical protein